MTISVSTLLLKQNRLDDALQMSDKSIKICARLELAGDSDTGGLGEALLSKALCLQALGNLEGATEMFKKLLILGKEVLGEMDPLIASTINILQKHMSDKE